MPKMPTVIRLKHIHNHALNITGSKRFLKSFFTLIIRHTVSQNQQSDDPPHGIEFNARSKFIDCAALVKEIKKQNKARILSDMEKVFSSMRSKAQSDPVFLKAVGNFTKAYKSIVSEHDRIAALNEFGNGKFQLVADIDRDNELEPTNETSEQSGGTEVVNCKFQLVTDIDRDNELEPTNETSEQSSGTEVVNCKFQLVADIDRDNELEPTNQTSEQSGGTEDRMEVKVVDISEAGSEAKIPKTVHDQVPNFRPIVHRIYPEISVAALNVKEEMSIVPCNNVPLFECNSRTLNQFVSMIPKQNSEFRIVTMPHSRRGREGPLTNGACFVGANLRCVPR